MHNQIFKTVQLSIVAFLLSSVSYSQSFSAKYEKLHNKSGETIDSVMIFDWSINLHERYKDLDWRFLHKTRLHDNRIDLTYNNKPKERMSKEELKYYRSNFAVYYSDDCTDFQLYKYGIGINDISFPVHNDGYYISLITWGNENYNNTKKSADGRLILSKVQQGIVYLYDVIKFKK